MEAKAHNVELQKEEQGKQLKAKKGKSVSADSLRNHVQIGACIQDASLALTSETNLIWSLSRDRNYQMANRFASAKKLAEFGIPVILVYLGFLACEEMRDEPNQRPIKNYEDWDEMVRAHSQPLFPAEVWNREWRVHGQSLIPLIRVLDQPLTVKLHS